MLIEAAFPVNQIERQPISCRLNLGLCVLFQSLSKIRRITGVKLVIFFRAKHVDIKISYIVSPPDCISRAECRNVCMLKP